MDSRWQHKPRYCVVLLMHSEFVSNSKRHFLYRLRDSLAFKGMSITVSCVIIYILCSISFFKMAWIQCQNSFTTRGLNPRQYEWLLCLCLFTLHNPIYGRFHHCYTRYAINFSFEEFLNIADALFLNVYTARKPRLPTHLYLNNFEQCEHNKLGLHPAETGWCR